MEFQSIGITYIFNMRMQIAEKLYVIVKNEKRHLIQREKSF